MIEDAVFDPSERRAAAARRKPAPRRRPEHEVVADVLIYIRSLPQGWAQKVHTGALGNKGEPDVDAVVRGRSCKLEGKAAGERPRRDQDEAMRRWGKAGALVGWFFSMAHVKALLDHLDEPDFVPDLRFPGCACPRHRDAA